MTQTLDMPQTATRQLVSGGLRWLFLAWSAYLAFLTCSFYWGLFSIERNHLDSAWLIEAAIGVACAAVTASEASGTGLASAEGLRVGPAAVAGVVAALVLYFPSLSIGLLSDDFTLLHRTVADSIAAVHDAMYRPAPVAFWAVVSRLLPDGAVPVALHGLNVALHGVNAALVALLARRLGASAIISVFCAALFLTFPGDVEAVAWASGIQDVLAAACVLGLLCLVTGRRTRAIDAAVMFLLGVALVTKESAVSAVVLAALWCVLLDDPRQRASRLWLCLAGAGATAVYVGWRLSVAGSRIDNQPSTTRRGVAHFLTSPFAALGSPWSSADLGHASLVGAAPCLLLLAAVVAFVLQPRARRQLVNALLLLVCALVAVAPVGRYFFVGADLQGSRYLYLPSAFWALFVGYVVAQTRVERLRLRAGVMIAVVMLFAVGVRVHLRPWKRAAQSRDEVLSSVAQAVKHNGCSTVAVLDVPDNVDGAYVFRNGLPEALASNGLSVRLVSAEGGEAPEACTLHVPQR